MTRPKRIITGIGIAAVLYLLSYSILSWFGGYRLVASGHFRPFSWLASEDVFAWQPRFGFACPFFSVAGKETHQSDLLGKVYLPLICLDQAYVHRTRPYWTVETDGKFKEHPWPPLAEMHPIARRAIRISNAIKAKYQHRFDEAEARGDKKEAHRLQTAAINEIEKALSQ